MPLCEIENIRDGVTYFGGWDRDNIILGHVECKLSDMCAGGNTMPGLERLA